LHHRRRDGAGGGAHTPTTINSEDNRTSGTATTEQEWSPPVGDDEMDDAEIDAMVSHTFHGEDSACSLSSCSSCSDEVDDFTANLEDDFDETLTFGPSDDDVNQAVRRRLNQAKRDHHNKRHMHHRRLRARALLKSQREEAAKGAPVTEDDWRSAQLNEDEIIRVGSYTQAERQRKIQRFLEKRRRRVWSKKILYSCRKNFADKRPRVGGRFVKIKEDGESAAGASSVGSGTDGTPGAEEHVGGVQGGGSLSTSPVGFSFPAGLGFHALTQHMHGLLGGGMTAFSLPLAAYQHTSLTPAAASSFFAAMQMPFPSPAAAAAASSVGSSALSFHKQETPPSAMSVAPAAPSALSAALAPRLPDAKPHPPAT